MTGTISVSVQLLESSQPVVYDNVVNTYTKGPFYCIYTADEVTYKHPLCTIWRVKEGYGYHGRPSQTELVAEVNNGLGPGDCKRIVADIARAAGVSTEKLLRGEVENEDSMA